MSDFANDDAPAPQATTEIQEVEYLLTKATFPGVKSTLQSHLNKLKKEEELKQRREEEAKRRQELGDGSGDVDINSGDRNTAGAPVVGTFIPVTDYAWDQGAYNSPTISIFVELEAVGSIKSNVSCTFSKNSFDLQVKDLKGKNYRLLVDNLEKDIVVAQSKYIVKANKVVVKLQKVKGEYSYEHWAHLTAKKKKSTEQETAKKADPMGGIMDMMKDMYEDGDDNMRKIIGEAMLKSRNGERPDPAAGGGMGGMGDLGDLGDMGM